MSETTSKNIYQALRAVQSELKAPKGQWNNFGKYNYRSCEDILEAVKPVLDKHNLTLVVSDELKAVGDRFYVMAVAYVALMDDDSKQTIIKAHGYAREEEAKKGMDGSQITGAASSYARKYALNGLFLIDDTKDADTDEHRKATVQTKPPVVASPQEHVAEVFDLPPKGTEITDAQLKRMMAHFNEMGISDREERLAYVTAITRRTIESSRELTRGEAVKVIDKQLADIEDKGGKA